MKFFLSMKTATVPCNFSIKCCSEIFRKRYIKAPGMKPFLIANPKFTSLIKRTASQVFYCEFCKIYHSTYLVALNSCICVQYVQYPLHIKNCLNVQKSWGTYSFVFTKNKLYHRHFEETILEFPEQILFLCTSQLLCGFFSEQKKLLDRRTVSSKVLQLLNWKHS